MIFSDWPWQHWRLRQGTAVALHTARETLTWQQLGKRVDALAGGFYQQGVREGDGVALCGKHSSQMLLAWLALWQCGARVLPLNPQLPQTQLTMLLPGLSLRYGLALEQSAPLPGVTPLEMRLGNPQRLLWQPDRLASMTLTSGSSGLPKAAVHPFRAHLASAAGVLSVIPFRADDCWLLSLPLYHVSGQGILWRWLLAGAQLATRGNRPLSQALTGCTHASLVPTQLWQLLEDPHRTPALKAVLLGGAAIPVALTEAATALGIACWCGYGLTEFASTVCAKRADGAADAGTLLPGRELRLVEGEIWLRGNSMALGYWRNGGVDAFTNHEGWFATRDRGLLCDGRLQVLGRLDNLFFNGGEGVQPEAVEQIIAAHPQVRQVLVVPQADAAFGHRPVAVVESDVTLSLDALARWANERLARFQQPVRWLPLPEGLKNGAIKVSRQALRAWLESGVQQTSL